MTVYQNTAMLKAQARESLLGHLTTAVLSLLMYSFTIVTLYSLISVLNTESLLITFVFSVITFVVLDIFGGLLEIGLDMEFLRFHYGKGAHVGDLFTAFRFNSNNCITVRFMLSMMDLVCMLPSLLYSAVSPLDTAVSLFIFYGLTGAGMLAVLYLRIVYALTPYMLLDFPQLTWQQVLQAGKKMMKGHKARLFRLYLSFVPLLLLGILSMGVANLWINSYLHASLAAFYKDRISALS